MSMQAVIFDLDGTLIDAVLKINEAKKEFIRRVRKLGVNIRAISPERPAEIIITYLERYYGMRRESLMTVLEKAFEPYELEAAERTKAKDGVQHVLERLKFIGCRIGLASNNSRKSVEIILKKLEIRELFDVVVARDDVKRLKPHEEIIVKAVSRLKTVPWRSLYVGDSAVDVIAGKRAGAYVAAITGGADSKEKLMRSRPDYLIDGLEEVFDVIKLIERRTF